MKNCISHSSQWPPIGVNCAVLLNFLFQLLRLQDCAYAYLRNLRLWLTRPLGSILLNKIQWPPTKNLLDFYILKNPVKSNAVYFNPLFTWLLVFACRWVILVLWVFLGSSVVVIAFHCVIVCVLLHIRAEKVSCVSRDLYAVTTVAVLESFGFWLTYFYCEVCCPCHLSFCRLAAVLQYA